MNENIDLTKILKDCPKGWKFWSPIFGEVSFHGIIYEEKRVYVISKTDEKWYFNADATITLFNITSIETMLYPSEYQRDWSKFTAPWLEKQDDSLRVNDRAWLYLVSDVLTWKDGIGQYLDNPRVQELVKRLCSEYAQKLYNPSVLSNSSNTGKNEQKFDPNTLQPYDKILVRDSDEYQWKCTLYSHQRGKNVLCKYVTTGASYEYCIPYNDDTKHLVGTTEEAPEYYRYWED